MRDSDPDGPADGGADEYANPDEGIPDGMDREEFGDALREGGAETTPDSGAETGSGGTGGETGTSNGGGAETTGEGLASETGTGDSGGAIEALDPVRRLSSDPLDVASGVTRRQVLGGIAAAGVGGTGLALGGQTLTSSSSTSSASGGIVYPVDTDVEGDCEGTDDEFSPTGADAANWFYLGECGEWKEYRVDPDTQYRIVAYADDCQLDEVSYVIEEPVGDGWQRVGGAGPRPITQGESHPDTNQYINGTFEQMDTEPTHEYLYSPESDRMRIRATDDPGSYISVYEYPLRQFQSSTTLGPEHWWRESAPVNARTRDQDLDEDHDLYVHRPGAVAGPAENYRFEYEGVASQSVMLHKREETRYYIVYWLELNGQCWTWRNDDPEPDPDSRHVDWTVDDGRRFQLLPPTDEEIEQLPDELGVLRDVEPPIQRIPTEVVDGTRYEVRTESGMSVRGFADRFAFSDQKPGLRYGSGGANDVQHYDAIGELVDIWDPTPDVPTSAKELALLAMTGDGSETGAATEAFGNLLAEATGEGARGVARAADLIINFLQTWEVLVEICDDTIREESLGDDGSGIADGDRYIDVTSCSRGFATHDAIVQIPVLKSDHPGQSEDSLTVEFESTFSLSSLHMAPGEEAPEESDFKQELTFVESVELPTELPGRERRACFEAENPPPEPVITIEPEPPVEQWTAVTLDASTSESPEASLDSFEWELEPPTREGESVSTQTYEGETVEEVELALSGEWEIWLRVTDTEGQSEEAVRTIKVREGEQEEGKEGEEEETPYFVDCFEDGNYTSGPRWFANTTPESSIEMVSSQPPDGGSHAVRLSDVSEGDQTNHTTVLNTDTRADYEEFGHQAWAYGGLFQPVAIPDRDETVAPPNSGFGGGFLNVRFSLNRNLLTRDPWITVYKNREEPDARPKGTAPTLEEGRWYRWELRHDGAGKYTLERWPANDRSAGNSLTAELGEPEPISRDAPGTDSVNMSVSASGGAHTAKPGTHPMTVDVACVYWQPLEE